MTDALHEVKLCVRTRAVDGANEFLYHNGIDGLIIRSLPHLDRTRRDQDTLTVRIDKGAGAVGIEAYRVFFVPFSTREMIPINNSVFRTLAVSADLTLIPSTNAVMVVYCNTVYIESGIDKTCGNNDRREHIDKVHSNVSAHGCACNENTFGKVVVLYCIFIYD